MSILDRVKEASKKAKGLSKNGSKKGSKSKSKKGSDKVEKKLIRKSKSGEDLDDLMDFSDIDSMIQDDSELSGVAGGTGDQDSQDSGLGKRVAGLEDKLVQMEGSVKSTRSRIGSMDERLADMEQNILKLLSVYEVVKRDINPFIESRKGASADDKIDPALLGIEGAELIKTPDVTDDLDEMDFGTDMLLSKDTENGSGIEEGTEEEGLDLSDIDLDEGPERPSLEEPPPVDEPPSMEDLTFPPDEIQTPESEIKGGADIRENENTQPISPPRVSEEPRVKRRAEPILPEISYDYRTVILVMRWIEFMFERVTRDRISALLDYYKDVGWISEKVKSQIMAYARGEIQNILRFEPEDVDEEVLLDSSPKQPSDYKKVSDWRLSADDHLKSLLFVTKIAGLEVNKDTFNSLEEEIKIFTRNLAGYHGV